MLAIAALALALAAARPGSRRGPSTWSALTAPPRIAMAVASPEPGALDVSAMCWVARPSRGAAVRYAVAVYRDRPDGRSERVWGRDFAAGPPDLPETRVPMRLDRGAYRVLVEALDGTPGGVAAGRAGGPARRRVMAAGWAWLRNYPRTLLRTPETLENKGVPTVLGWFLRSARASGGMRGRE
jgi:hypothetical protein